MHDWVEQLLNVQDIDLRMGQLQEQIDSVPGEKREVESLLSDATDAAAQAKTDVQEKEKELKKLEIEAETEETHRRDFQAKSTMIKSNDEYKAAMHQIEVTSMRIDKLEERQLIVMEELEALRVVLRDRDEDLAAAKARVEELQADLDTRARNCAAALERLKQKRGPAAAAVPAASLSRYERIRSSRRANRSDRRILVPVRDGVCDRCRMNVTAQTRVNARKGQLVSCENCGVLLYAED